MRRRPATTLLGALAGLALAAVLGRGASEAREPDEVLPKYVGARSCKLCHIAPSTGAQHKIWQNSRHSKAYEVLATDKAKEFAKAKGIADAQKAAECLKCHVTGHGLPTERFGEKFSLEEGVSCESCHGPGEFYATKEVFEKGREEAIAKGLVIPDEKLCRTCHNEESPAYKEFHFEEFKKKIEHPKPKAEGGK